MPVPPLTGVDPEAVLAEAISETRLTLQVAVAARHSWQAAAWLLERKFPERWARPPAREPGRQDESAANAAAEKQVERWLALVPDPPTG